MTNIIRLDRVRQQQRYRCLLRDIVTARTDDSRQRLRRIALVYFARRLNDLGVVRCHWKLPCNCTEILTGYHRLPPPRSGRRARRCSCCSRRRPETR